MRHYQMVKQHLAKIPSVRLISIDKPLLQPLIPITFVNRYHRDLKKQQKITTAFFLMLHLLAVSSNY
jgi:hypothetical protein